MTENNNGSSKLVAALGVIVFLVGVGFAYYKSKNASHSESDVKFVLGDKPPSQMKAPVAQAGGNLLELLNSSPEAIAKGAEVYKIQCLVCHGAEGKGDGVAGAALNPKPRNFNSPDGWKQGRSAIAIWKTLKTGIPGTPMPGFAHVSAAERWAIVHYINGNMNKNAPENTPAELEEFNKEAAASGTSDSSGVKPIPVFQAMEELEQKTAPVVSAPTKTLSNEVAQHSSHGFYKNQCAKCHGDAGEGKNYGVGLNPYTLIDVPSFQSMKNQGRLSAQGLEKVLTTGMPGKTHPSHAQMTNDDVQDLYSYLELLAR